MVNIRQQRFIEHYIANGNATQALIAAGYKTKWPQVYCNELLKKPYMQAELAKTRAAMTENAKWTIEYKLDALYTGIAEYMRCGEYDKAAKLIEVTNKMQGHNAPDKSINTNTTLTHEQALLELK